MKCYPLIGRDDVLVAEMRTHVLERTDTGEAMLLQCPDCMQVWNPHALDCMLHQEADMLAKKIHASMN